MSRPLDMQDDKYPRLDRFEIRGTPHTALQLGDGDSRLITDGELDRLRDAIIADRGLPEPEPPMWTAEPPERDCFWKPHRSGRNTPTSLRYRDKRYWTDQSSYSPGQMLYSGENGGQFLVIPGGIPVCPEVMP